MPLSTSFVAPATREAITWLQSQEQAAQLDRPEGLEMRWTGDALIGRDYMSNVQISLHRAAVATVVLLLGVLFVVYHSVWLAVIPMATIGISLVISRSVLAWMTLAGWGVSPLVELLFVTVLGAAGIDWKVPYFLFVLLVAVGVDYNVFLMTRLREESRRWELRGAMIRAVGRTGGLITSAAAITACSFASFLFSPLGSLRQLGFALVVGITIDALIVRPLLVPCGHWLMKCPGEWRQRSMPALAVPGSPLARGLTSTRRRVGLRPSNDCGLVLLERRGFGSSEAAAETIIAFGRIAWLLFLRGPA